MKAGKRKPRLIGDLRHVHMHSIAFNSFTCHSKSLIRICQFPPPSQPQQQTANLPQHTPPSISRSAHLLYGRQAGAPGCLLGDDPTRRVVAYVERGAGDAGDAQEPDGGAVPTKGVGQSGRDDTGDATEQSLFVCLWGFGCCGMVGERIVRQAQSLSVVQKTHTRHHSFLHSMSFITHHGHIVGKGCWCVWLIRPVSPYTQGWCMRQAGASVMHTQTPNHTHIYTRTYRWPCTNADRS